MADTKTNASGTLAAANVSQQLVPQDKTRTILFFQNVSAADLWLREGSAATTAQPSIKVPAGTTFIDKDGICMGKDGAVNVIGGTISQAFVCWVA